MQLGIFRKFYRRNFCEIDDWIGLGMGDIRALEEETRQVLARRLDELDLPTRLKSAEVGESGEEEEDE